MYLGSIFELSNPTPGDQLTALNASRGQILLDDEHRDPTPP
jgi:hypothetical protein